MEDVNCSQKEKVDTGLTNLVAIPKNKRFEIGKIYNAPLKTKRGNEHIIVFDVYGTLEDLIYNNLFYRTDIYEYKVIEPSSMKILIENMDIFKVETLDKEDLFPESNYWNIVGSCKIKILEKVLLQNCKDRFPKDLRKSYELVNNLLKLQETSKIEKTFILEDIKYAHNMLYNSIPSKKSDIALNNFETYSELSKELLISILRDIKYSNIKCYSKKSLTKKANIELESVKNLRKKYLNKI